MLAVPRRPNGYREYGEPDLARLRILISLRRLGLSLEAAARLADLCVEPGEMDGDLAPLLHRHREAIARQRGDLNRLEGELTMLEEAFTSAGRRRARRPRGHLPLRVLFVCTHNRARSQLAEALLSEYGGTDFEVNSAGTQATTVHPYTIRVLAEIGIDWSTARSKSIEEFAGERFDYVITVCDRARETCQLIPGSENTMHWALADPSLVEGPEDDVLAGFRQTRRELTSGLRPFVEVALRTAGRTPRISRP